MAIGLLICLLVVGAQALTEPQTMDEAIRSVFGKGVSTRGQGGTVRDGMDMVLTRAQHDALYGKGQGRSRGAAVTLWTNGVIPYQITPNVFDKQRINKIEQGMRTWEQLTCIRFHETFDNRVHKIHFISADGCWSLLGMNEGYHQQLSLNYDGCFWRGTVEHELGHAIGLVHEHQRPNRDEHLRINFDNVDPEFEDQLTMYGPSVSKLGLPYDYHSVMHYGHYAFTINNKLPTIYAYNRATSRPLDHVNDFIGKVLGPSFTDVKLVNTMYNCDGHCRSKPRCRAGCFVDQNCKCFCENDMPRLPCEDSSNQCRNMKPVECFAQRFNNEIFCRKTCGLCADRGSTLPPKQPNVRCEDYGKADDCRYWSRNGECSKNAPYMGIYCRKSCRFC